MHGGDPALWGGFGLLSSWMAGPETENYGDTGVNVGFGTRARPKFGAGELGSLAKGNKLHLSSFIIPLGPSRVRD